jgi:hypothetical protein
MTFAEMLITLAVLATAGALGLGIVSMMRGGRFDREHAGRYMTARIGLQGMTLVLLLAVLALV